MAMALLSTCIVDHTPHGKVLFFGCICEYKNRLDGGSLMVPFRARSILVISFPPTRFLCLHLLLFKKILTWKMVAVQAVNGCGHMSLDCSAPITVISDGGVQLPSDLAPRCSNLTILDWMASSLAGKEYLVHAA